MGRTPAGVASVWFGWDDGMQSVSIGWFARHCCTTTTGVDPGWTVSIRPRIEWYQVLRVSGRQDSNQPPPYRPQSILLPTLAVPLSVLDRKALSAVGVGDGCVLRYPDRTDLARSEYTSYSEYIYRFG